MFGDEYYDLRYCKRCSKPFYPTFSDEWHRLGEDSYYKWQHICPKCQYYYEKNPIEFKILRGEYKRCNSCRDAVRKEELNESGLCEKCVLKFKNHPFSKDIYEIKQGLIKAGWMALGYTICAIVIAVFLAIVYFWVCACIGNFLSPEDWYNEGLRMKP